MNLRMNRRLWSASCCTGVALVSFAVMAIWFWPGILQSDSLGQLWAGRTGVYSDMHPVLMGWLLGVFDRVIPGPGLGFMFQCALWLAGLGMLVHLGFEHPAASPWIAAAAFWPPILAHLVVVQSDTQMAAALLFAMGMMAWATRRTTGRGPLAAALAALLYAQACRHEAIVAVVPLLVLWVRLALRKTQVSTAKAAVMALLIGAGWAASLQLITYRLTSGKSQHPAQEIFLSDLAAMSVREGVDLFPAYLHAGRPDVNLDWIRSHYRPDTINELIFSSDRISWDGSLHQRADLRMSWWRAVIAHPVIYASVRLDLFAYLLGLRPGLLMPVFTHTELYDYPIELSVNDSRYHDFMSWVHRRVEDGIWFRTWFYALILAISGMALVYKRDLLGICLQLSAWLYLFSHLVASPNADFRYGWWVIVASLTMPAVIALAWRTAEEDSLPDRRAPVARLSWPQTTA